MSGSVNERMRTRISENLRKRINIQKNMTKFCSKLYELGLEGKYTDVTINCIDGTIKCHRLVLAASSIVFDRMFSGSFREKASSTITLCNVHLTTLKEILQFIYTGDVPVSTDNVGRLLEASDYLAIGGIEEVCVNFVRTTLHKIPIHITLDLLLFACKLGNEELMDLMCPVIASKLLSIVSMDTKFLDISFNDLITLMKQQSFSSSLKCGELCDVVVQWILHNSEERLKYFDQIVDLIDFKNMAPEYAKCMFKNVMHSVTNNARLRNWTADCSTISDPPKGKLLHLYVKYPKSNLLKVFSLNSVVENYAIDKIPETYTNRWIRSIVLEDEPMHLYSLYYTPKSAYKTIRAFSQSFNRHTLVNLHVPSSQSLMPAPVMFSDVHLASRPNNIYVYNQTSSEQEFVSGDQTVLARFTTEEAKRGIYLYNCEVNNWFPVPAIPHKWKDCGMVVSDNLLYIIGGRPCQNGSMQVYDYRTGEWQRWETDFFKGADHLTMGLDCCVLNGKIYTCVGSQSGAGLARYDPVARTWETLACLKSSKQFHQVVAYSDKIWAVRSSAIEIEKTDDLSLNIYNPVLNTWDTSYILAHALRENMNSSNRLVIDAVVF